MWLAILIHFPVTSESESGKVNRSFFMLLSVMLLLLAVQMWLLIESLR